MVWTDFCAAGKLDIEFIIRALNADACIEVLESRLVPFLSDCALRNVMFQQDSAPVHSAVPNENWFEQQKIGILPWPAKSADMNPIGNLQGMLTRSVYAEDRRFETVSDLKEAILYAWDNVSLAALKNWPRACQTA